MIPWVCIFYSVHEDRRHVKERLVYRGTDFEKKTDRTAILKMVIQQGLGDISGLDKIIEQEMERCKEEGLNYSMAVYYNHVLVEADIMNNVLHGEVMTNPWVGLAAPEVIKQIYFELQNLYQEILK